MKELCEIVLLDDDPTDLLILKMFCKKLELNVSSFHCPQKALDYLLNRKNEFPFLLVSDISMPQLTGFELLEQLTEIYGHAPVVFVSGSDSLDDPVKAMRMGAFDFLVKPVHRELFEARIKNAIDRIIEKNEIKSLQNNLYSGRSLKNFVGRSAAIQQVYKTVMQVGKFDSTVLITGESGVGKEHIARTIHECSPRHSKPFVAVNSASIPDSLIESELFGYKKGAFTGAIADKVGLIEASSGGTLFLDEIGELPLHLQAKLLRVLQEKVVRPVGAKENVSVDLRVVCATHRDLSKMQRAGEFREDLFYRLNVIPVKVPPLRERKEDLEVLIPFIMNKISEKWKVKKFLPIKTFKYLANHDWPGNIRELENVLERAFVLSQGDCIMMSDLLIDNNSSNSNAPQTELFPKENGRYLTLQELELKYVRKIMQVTATKEEAAKVLGIGRKTLYRKEELL